MVVVYLCSVSSLPESLTATALSYNAILILVTVTLAVIAAIYMRPTLTHVVSHYSQLQARLTSPHLHSTAKANKLTAN